MDKLIKLVEDIGKLITHYYPAYLTGIRNTLILAIAATLVGCIIGLVCGILGPLLSSLLTGMPPAAMLPSMMVECAVYGIVSGLLLKFVHTKKLHLDLYIALVGAMLAGRIVAGIAKALFFTGGEGYSFALWISSHFVTSAPGIICHLILVPLLMMALYRARLIPARYSR